jgi:predicted transcriptional regulator
MANVNTSDTVRRVAKPPMVMRSIRVPAKLWDAAKSLADEREESISDVIREALERYVKRGAR